MDTGLGPQQVKSQDNGRLGEMLTKYCLDTHGYCCSYIIHFNYPLHFQLKKLYQGNVLGLFNVYNTLNTFKTRIATFITADLV